jgi:hypothetical protein
MDADKGTDYAQGFVDGLKESARTLREAARDHYEQSIASKKVLEAQAHQLAAALFASWANGLDIRADNFLNSDPSRARTLSGDKS